MYERGVSDILVRLIFAALVEVALTFELAETVG